MLLVPIKQYKPICDHRFFDFQFCSFLKENKHYDDSILVLFTHAGIITAINIPNFFHFLWYAYLCVHARIRVCVWERAKEILQAQHIPWAPVEDSGQQ